MTESPSSNEDRKREEEITADDNPPEKTKSPQLIKSRRGTFQSNISSSSSYEGPSDGALTELVPQLTRRGTINPDSPYFSTEKLLRDVLARAKEQGIRRRNAGVVFRSLVVMGYGSEFTHQNTVGTVATGIFRIADTIRQKRHPPMKTILHSMDGVVREGEMLLVLGKPGSGATTLLKTIAGETRGYASVSGGAPSYKRSNGRYPLQWNSCQDYA
jgi:ATP-binding cassette, subfamily G (WHITE), member 2, PDR